MTTAGQSIDVETVIEKLDLDGYTVIEGLLDPDELAVLRTAMETQFKRQRTAPYERV